MDKKQKTITDNQEKIARNRKALSIPIHVSIPEYPEYYLNKRCYSGDLAEILPGARSSLSQHLKELKSTGLIQGETNPPYIRYCISPDNWQEAGLLFHYSSEKILTICFGHYRND